VWFSLRLVSLPTWINLNEDYRNKLLQGKTRLQKQWRFFLKRDSEDSQDQPAAKKHKSEHTVGEVQGTKPSSYYEKYLLWELTQGFLSTLSQITPESHPSILIEFSQKFVELVTDLLAQLPTRRYFRSLLESCFFVPQVKLSPLYTLTDGK
jgi:intron-binding protein aquarius